MLCRILEKLVRNEIVEYMQSEKLFSHLQFGFLKGRSTSLQLLNIMNDWTSSIANGTFNDCIYLDYQKAFDTVSHNRLISKLYAYNLDARIIKWIKYYLSERKQFVEINGKKSEWQNVTSGIPQGSVLGPLLFLIYINDLPDGIMSNIYMYADDTKLYREIKSPEDHQILQNDLTKLCVWSKKWLLKFHPKKCSCLSTGKKKSLCEYVLLLSSHVIEQVVTIDSNLTFNEHINIKIDTANKILGIIRWSHRFLICETFLPLYRSMVRSHFDYAVSVWDPYKIKHISDIEDVQRRATKLIPEIKNLSYPERLRKLKLPTLSYRRIRGQMIKVYKIINNKNVSENILTFRPNADFNLRGNDYTVYFRTKENLQAKMQTFFSAIK